MVQILQNEYATLSMHEERRRIEVTWLQHCEEGLFRGILSKALHYANSHETTRWLCDMRGLRYMLLADQNWLVGKLLPSLNPSLQNRFAYVVSRKNLELMSSLRIQDMVSEDTDLSQRLKVEIFLEKEHAADWLA